LFERYDLEDADERRLSYEQLAREFGLSVTDVTNHLAFARREFRRIALEKLREMTATEEEFRREASALFGLGTK
jgi:DNA-directed RNA polymerase specialized sigma24 family protein